MTRRRWLKQVLAMGAFMLLGVQRPKQRSLRVEMPLKYPGRVIEKVKVIGPGQWGG